MNQCVKEKGYDYGAAIIHWAAGGVMLISLSLILLVVGNMIYTSVTDKVVLRDQVRIGEKKGEDEVIGKERRTDHSRKGVAL